MANSIFKLIRNKTVETFTRVLANRGRGIELYYNSDMYDYRYNSDYLTSLLESLTSISEMMKPTTTKEYGLIINTDKITTKTIDKLDFIIKNIINYKQRCLIVTDKNVDEITALTENVFIQLDKLGVKFNDRYK